MFFGQGREVRRPVRHQVEHQPDALPDAGGRQTFQLRRGAVERTDLEVIERGIQVPLLAVAVLPDGKQPQQIDVETAERGQVGLQRLEAAVATESLFGHSSRMAVVHH